MLLLISLSKVELLLIKAHFSYARAAYGMFFTLSYAQITFLWVVLNVYYSNSTIRLQIHTTLMTSQRGEQSVPGAIQRELPCACRRAAFSNQNFRLCIFSPVYLLVALVISYTFYIIFLSSYFFNVESSVTDWPVAVSLPNNIMYISIVFLVGRS